MSAISKIPVSMSVEEFLDWTPPEGGLWQLVDGEPQAMAPASSTHGAIAAELARLLGNHLADVSSPCRVIVEPGIVPRVLASQNVRVPDLAVTCSPASADAQVLEEPIVVIEILSPNNQAETWANVWTYTTIPSVREILILRTAVIGAELLRRSDDGSWPNRPESLGEGEIDLHSIGFRVRLSEIYRTTKFYRAEARGE